MNRALTNRFLRSSAAALLALVLSAPAALSQDRAASGEDRLPPAGTFSGALLAARSAERAADYDTAVKFFREAIGFAEDAQVEGLRQSLLQALVLTGQFDEAVELASQLNEDGGVTVDPQNLILLTLVTDALSSREYNRATQFLDVAGMNDLETLVLDGMLAWAQQGLGDANAADEAINGLDADGRAEWVRFYARYLRGMLAEQRGDPVAARKAYESAVNDQATGSQLPESYARAATALATLDVRAGNADAAREVIANARSVIGNDVAFDAIERAIEAGAGLPPHVEGIADGAGELLYGLGTALSGGRTGDLARNYLQFSRALASDPALSLLALARLEEIAQRPEKAVALYDVVPPNSPFAVDAALQRGLNLADMEKLDEAIDTLSGVRQERPDDLRVVLALGNTFALDERWSDAASLYDEAIANIDEASARDWVLYYRRAIAFERMKEWPKAEADFLQALELRPDHPPVLNYLGYSWIDMNMNLDEALGMIEKAVSLQPNSGAYVDSLGWAHYRLGNFDEAVEQLERALSLETSDPVIHDHLGDAYWRVGREREARYQWGHALRMDLEPEDRKRIRRKLTEGLEPVAEKGDDPAKPDRA